MCSNHWLALIYMDNNQLNKNGNYMIYREYSLRALKIDNLLIGYFKYKKNG